MKNSTVLLLCLQLQLAACAASVGKTIHVGTPDGNQAFLDYYYNSDGKLEALKMMYRGIEFVYGNGGPYMGPGGLLRVFTWRCKDEKVASTFLQDTPGFAEFSGGHTLSSVDSPHIHINLTGKLLEMSVVASATAKPLAGENPRLNRRDVEFVHECCSEVKKDAHGKLIVCPEQLLCSTNERQLPSARLVCTINGRFICCKKVEASSCQVAPATTSAAAAGK